jgi:hypothetical protein
MAALVEIPLIDIRGQSPVALTQAYPDKARALVSAATNTFGFASRAASRIALPLGDRASKAWLARCNNPHAREIDAIAAHLGLRGTHALNVCFEWGCTSGVWEIDGSPHLNRVLDWAFPALGEHLVVALQSGAAGDFYNITWPGLTGSFQALAPGRFAAAINQAPMRRHNAGYIGDWLNNRIETKRQRGLPPAHLLRHVFETAPDYTAAKKLLCETEIAVPAIFILSGIKSGEGGVIERTENDFAVRALTDACVCVANHFETRLNATDKGWRARPIDSIGRAQSARALQEEDFAQPFGWFRAPIANTHSRLAFEADAATGSLFLMGTAGDTPVTEVFRLAA